jgi:hypothetical protein
MEGRIHKTQAQQKAAAQKQAQEIDAQQEMTIKALKAQIAGVDAKIEELKGRDKWKPSSEEYLQKAMKTVTKSSQVDLETLSLQNILISERQNELNSLFGNNPGPTKRFKK